jgi:hypothetical protein
MKTTLLRLGTTHQLLCFAFIALTLPGTAAQFEDVTAAAGLTNVAGSCSGVAWGDYDNDKNIDLYVAIGSSPVVNALYRNDGDGTFTRVGAEAGHITTNRADSLGCAWIDFNNDGWRDLFVDNGGWTSDRNNLYWNLGHGAFSQGEATGLTALSQFRSWPACADYNGDGWVDILLGESGSLEGLYTLQLYEASGQGTFKPRKLGSLSGRVNDAVWGDYDNDGDPDLYVCPSAGTNSLLRNDGSGKFTGVTLGLPTWASATHAAWADYDRDGDLDLSLSDFGGTVLYRNNGTNGFARAAYLPLAIACAAWADYDNDGYLDLLAAVGQGEPKKAALYHNNGDGTFSSVSDVFTQTADSWFGQAWGDFDNDGFMDAVLIHLNGRNRLYHNLGNTNHWIKFKLTGTASNRDAIGAKVRLLATIGGQTGWQMQEVNGGYSIQNDVRLNFGLGDATNVDLVRIEWPSGNVQELTNQGVDQILAVSEQSYISPARPSGSLGSSVTLGSQRSGTWQWFHDGVASADWTNQTLRITNLVAADAGRYSVVVDTGSATFTNHVYLFVDTQFTKVTQGRVVTDSEDSWGSDWVDYDQDGDVDLFVANGLFAGSQLNALYRNDGNGIFTRMTAATAGDIANEPGAWGQAAWADYDNDGLPDAMVVGRSGTALYRNLGQGMFDRRRDLVPAAWPSGPGPCFADFDNDGWVDWFVGSAVNDNTSVRNNSLYRNIVGQRFAPVTNGAVVQDRFSDTESGMWGDHDGDGDLDLVITLGTEPRVRLYENLGGGAFRRAQTTGLEDPLGSGAFPVEAVWADYDNDLRLDLFVAVYSSTANVLFHNEGGGTFTRRFMGRAGVQQGHPAWADLDNDGWLDLFLARGQSSGDPNQLWHNNGDGTFTEITAGTLVTEQGNSQGAAWGDYDNDGFMDLFVANGNGRNFLYHNSGSSNHWLKVSLKGTTSNGSAIGAKVKVQATINGRTFWQMREVPGGNRCQDDLRSNFGLGNARVARLLRIEWPSGTVQQFAYVAVNQILTITEPRRPLLTVISMLPQRLDGTLKADPNASYDILVSADLATWTPLTTVTTDGAGGATWSDTAVATEAIRFYRAVSKL